MAASVLALGVAALSLAPLELQRRVIDNAIAEKDEDLLVTLAIVYLAAVLLHRVLRYSLVVFQGWLSESATRYSRRHISRLLCAKSGDEDGVKEPGRAVSVLGGELDRLGGYVGEVPSQAVSGIATLLGTGLYMALVQPKVALIGFVLLLPQIILVPLMQQRLNRLNEKHVEGIRELGDDVAEMGNSVELAEPLLRIYRVRMRIHIWKGLMKSLLGLASHLAPLGILVWGGMLVLDGETSLGVVVAFVNGFERMQSPAKELVKLYRQTANATVQHRMVASWITEGGIPDDLPPPKKV
ncbi:MAG: ABC transporter ATP-binding protein [Pseudomonadota bacterium]